MREDANSSMNNDELTQYAEDLDVRGYAEEYIIEELARVMSGESPRHLFAYKIQAGTITTEKINISPDGVFIRTENGF